MSGCTGSEIDSSEIDSFKHYLDDLFISNKVPETVIDKLKNSACSKNAREYIAQVYSDRKKNIYGNEYDYNNLPKSDKEELTKLDKMKDILLEIFKKRGGGGVAKQNPLVVASKRPNQKNALPNALANKRFYIIHKNRVLFL